MTTQSSTTIDQDEVARFEKLAQTWWDEKGPMGILHRFNPTRLSVIRGRALKHFKRDGDAARPFEGLSVVDIGCGGGLLCEPLRRLGAEVTGLDPAPTNIEVAKRHAVKSGLAIDYQQNTIEAVVKDGRRFDIVLAMEVVEHVADINVFVEACTNAVKPGGLLVMATLNRTLKSFALAIVGAEYVLRWLPRGTHQWNKFVTPAELTDAIERGRMAIDYKAGVVLNPLTRQWVLSRDMDVNYIV
ncbi:MAG: bifunctional 2-polyprenyl-6-hydroxyphenol methylase/3-demethylubiquinol 3-O-methyltransferase UbiG, partial [Betaproteobacteria bacterium]|nr:bifunctional 2-polyprenyl-6-hydroxyphenol methylase/3-demethylubiquinol 3-O-methyltransferase UbiG [Betaproteobacteria bacterium]